MSSDASVPISSFEAFYASRADPYDMKSRWYEERKRSLTVAALSRKKYDAGLEVAAGEGALTRLLADRCRSLLATEGSLTALDRAYRDLGDLNHVRWVHHVIPDPLPGSEYDLAVVAEVGYFLSQGDQVRMRDDLVARVVAGGEVLAVHWRHASENYPGTGEQVHDTFHRDARLTPLVHLDDPDFVLDSWLRQPD